MKSQRHREFHLVICWFATHFPDHISRELRYFEVNQRDPLFNPLGKGRAESSLAPPVLK
jgi:hypothetical protein